MTLFSHYMKVKSCKIKEYIIVVIHFTQKTLLEIKME